MSRLAKLKAATSLNDVASLLDMPASALAYTLYVIPGQAKYSIFTIPKKSGGMRTIQAPSARLKDLQRRLTVLLSDCRSEIEKAAPRRIVSHAFRSDASIITNARQHRRRKYVFNLDLEGFFPAFNFGRVRGFFEKNKTFSLHPKVATVLAQIACDGSSLPQGSPCSPIISDLIAHILDIRMLRLAKRHKCTYSRYADDLTFSTNRNDFPVALAYQLSPGNSAWLPGPGLLGEVNSAGFSINHKKTRMQYRDNRQVVTGLTVNTTINIRADYYRGARSKCHTLFKTGTFAADPAQLSQIGPSPAGTLAQLEGVLNHIYHVKRVEDERLRRVPSYKDRHGIELLYGRFLFFKKFVAHNRPIIITEGKTDGIYLRSAIKQLPAFAGVLSTVTGGKNFCEVTFLRHSNIAREMLALGGSSSYLSEFISSYATSVNFYKHAPLTQPVIILIDNDSGASGVFSTLSGKKVAINLLTTADFYHVQRNLYLVKTPESLPAGTSQIEDCFDVAALSITLNGKKFNRAKTIDPLTEYGKVPFADHIAANADKINFAGFVPLLNRIVSVKNFHALAVAAGTV